MCAALVRGLSLREVAAVSRRKAILWLFGERESKLINAEWFDLQPPPRCKVFVVVQQQQHFLIICTARDLIILSGRDARIIPPLLLQP